MPGNDVIINTDVRNTHTIYRVLIQYDSSAKSFSEEVDARYSLINGDWIIFHNGNPDLPIAIYVSRVVISINRFEIES